MKYPIGIQNFDQIIEGNYVYIDKTDLIYRLGTEGKACCGNTMPFAALHKKSWSTILPNQSLN